MNLEEFSKILFSDHVIEQIHAGAYKSYFCISASGIGSEGWSSLNYMTENETDDDWRLTFAGLLYPNLYRGDILLKLDKSERKKLRQIRKLLIENDKSEAARKEAEHERLCEEKRWWQL